MKNIRLLIEYEGTDYAGWQRQAHDPTIQGRLETALKSLDALHGPLYGSGRTDAGVHAFGQVANFRTASSIPPERFAPALNAHLPRDIAVLMSAEVGEDFHARFGARSKTYLYTVFTGAARPALGRNLCHHVSGPLDDDAMTRAAALLPGTWDFAGFSCTGSPVRSTVRTLTRFEMGRRGPYLVFLVSADGFLYKMVRTLMGTLLAVGSGKMTPGCITEILSTADRKLAGPSAPARGLSLLGVRYEDWKTPLEGVPLAALWGEKPLIFC
jgi:tRNA pseudouridine38-40 synthase